MTDHRPYPYRFEDHADEVSIFVRLVDYPSEQPTVVVAVGLPGPVSSEEVVGAVRGSDEPHPFVLSKRETVLDWGASATSVRYLLDLAAGFSEEAIIAGLFYLVGVARNRKITAATQEPLDRESALNRARFTVAINYDVRRDDLDVDGEARDTASNLWEFTLVTPAGQRFDITVSQAPGAPAVTRVRRN